MSLVYTSTVSNRHTRDACSTKYVTMF